MDKIYFAPIGEFDVVDEEGNLVKPIKATKKLSKGKGVIWIRDKKGKYHLIPEKYHNKIRLVPEEEFNEDELENFLKTL